MPGASAKLYESNPRNAPLDVLPAAPHNTGMNWDLRITAGVFCRAIIIVS